MARHRCSCFLARDLLQSRSTLEFSALIELVISALGESAAFTDDVRLAIPELTALSAHGVAGTICSILFSAPTVRQMTHAPKMSTHGRKHTTYMHLYCQQLTHTICGTDFSNAEHWGYLFSLQIMSVKNGLLLKIERIHFCQRVNICRVVFFFFFNVSCTIKVLFLLAHLTFLESLKHQSVQSFKVYIY